MEKQNKHNKMLIKIVYSLPAQEFKKYSTCPFAFSIKKVDL